MIFPWQAKKKAIKKFAIQLPADLAKEYGARRKFSPEEIEAVFKKYHYHHERKYWCYGYALHSSRLEFDAYHLKRHEVCDFDKMRSEAVDTVLITGALGGGVAGEFIGSEGNSSSDGGSDASGGSD